MAGILRRYRVSFRRFIQTMCSGLFGALTIILPLHAQDHDTDIGTALVERFYVSPMASYLFVDGARDADNGVGAALALGKRIDPVVSVEAAGYYSRLDRADGSETLTITGYGMSMLISPFAEARGLYGVLSASYAPTTPGSDEIAVDVGVGYLVGPFGWLNQGALRLEARARIGSADAEVADGGNSQYTDGVLNLGFVLPFGRAPESQP
jgi:hypothetical protein